MKSTIKVTPLICPAPYTLLVVITLAACLVEKKVKMRHKTGEEVAKLSHKFTQLQVF